MLKLARSLAPFGVLKDILCPCGTASHNAGSFMPEWVHRFFLDKELLAAFNLCLSCLKNKGELIVTPSKSECVKKDGALDPKFW